MEDSQKIQTVGGYISQFPPEVREKLDGLRAVIRKEAPGAKEKISYGMPSYSLEGALAYFAAFKKHIGFYPGASGVQAFLPRLAGYKTSKGTIQFPLDRPLPLDLVREIVRFRADENAARAAIRKRKTE